MTDATLVKSLREGTGLTQKDAAERLGVTPPTLAAYEVGRYVPSPELMWKIARSLAIGSPGKGETNPRFLISYLLFGQCFAADAKGRLVTFRDPWRAHAAAELLLANHFHEVVVVPVWRGSRRALLRQLKAEGEVNCDNDDKPLVALIEYVQRLADDFGRRQLSRRPARSRT